MTEEKEIGGKVKLLEKLVEEFVLKRGNDLIFSLSDLLQFVELLQGMINRKDKRIKELEVENEKLSQEIDELVCFVKEMQRKLGVDIVEKTKEK